MKACASPPAILKFFCCSTQITNSCASKFLRPRSPSSANNLFSFESVGAADSTSSQKIGACRSTPLLVNFVLPRVELGRARLTSERPLSSEHRPGTPQRIPLRMPVRVLVRRRIRVGGHRAKMARARHRRGLRQPRRITDRAEVHRRCSHVVADRLQPLQYRLPLLPIQLLQKRTQTLDERILE